MALKRHGRELAALQPSAPTPSRPQSMGKSSFSSTWHAGTEPHKELWLCTQVFSLASTSEGIKARICH